MRKFVYLAAAGAAAIVAAATLLPKAHAELPVERGKYLVNVAGCNDCHTPGFFFGKPDMTRYLGGSDVGFEIPGLGVFNGRNITPDKETGIGAWTDEQVATAITTGKRPGRPPIGADHELRRLYLHDERGCRGGRRLSSQHTGGQQQGTGTVQAGRESVDLHIQDRAARTDGGRRAEVDLTAAAREPGCD